MQAAGGRKQRNDPNDLSRGKSLVGIVHDQLNKSRDISYNHNGLDVVRIQQGKTYD